MLVTETWFQTICWGSSATNKNQFYKFHRSQQKQPIKIWEPIRLSPKKNSKKQTPSNSRQFPFSFIQNLRKKKSRQHLLLWTYYKLATDTTQIGRLTFGKKIRYARLDRDTSQRLFLAFHRRRTLKPHSLVWKNLRKLLISFPLPNPFRFFRTLKRFFSAPNEKRN